MTPRWCFLQLSSWSSQRLTLSPLLSERVTFLNGIRRFENHQLIRKMRRATDVTGMPSGGQRKGDSDAASVLTKIGAPTHTAFIRAGAGSLARLLPVVAPRARYALQIVHTFQQFRKTPRDSSPMSCLSGSCVDYDIRGVRQSVYSDRLGS